MDYSFSKPTAYGNRAFFGKGSAMAVHTITTHLPYSSSTAAATHPFNHRQYQVLPVGLDDVWNIHGLLFHSSRFQIPVVGPGRYCRADRGSRSYHACRRGGTGMGTSEDRRDEKGLISVISKAVLCIRNPTQIGPQLRQISEYLKRFPKIHCSVLYTFSELRHAQRPTFSEPF